MSTDIRPEKLANGMGATQGWHSERDLYGFSTALVRDLDDQFLGHELEHVSSIGPLERRRC